MFNPKTEFLQTHTLFPNSIDTVAKNGDEPPLEVDLVADPENSDTLELVQSKSDNDCACE